MYRLFQFGSVSLEHYNQVDAIGSGPTPTAYQALPEGGALDGFGDQQKHPGTVERSKSLRLKASTDTALKELYFAMLAMRGKRDRLYRESVDGNIEWCYARLVEVSATRDYQLTRFRTLQDVELRFVQQDAFWRGDSEGLFLDGSWNLDDGLYLDSGINESLSSSPETFDIIIGTDAGRAPTRAMVITVNPGDAAMNNIEIARTGGEILTFAGSVAVSESLLIDTGTMQVTNGGDDAYNDMQFEPTADRANWFTLEPGTNEITVTFDGGGSGASIQFDFYEVWF